MTAVAALVLLVLGPWPGEPAGSVPASSGDLHFGLAHLQGALGPAGPVVLPPGDDVPPPGDDVPPSSPDDDPPPDENEPDAMGPTDRAPTEEATEPDDTVPGPDPETASSPEPPEDGPPEPDAAPTDASAQGEGDGDEPIGMEDIFGTSEDHEEIEEVPAAGGVAPGATEDVPALSSTPPTLRMWDKLDTRFRVISSAYYDVHKTDRRKFGRNENRLEFYFAYTPNDHLQIVGDIEAVFMGVAQAQELDDVATRQMITPFHFESDAAYVALYDVLPNLDIKIGRQILVWGTADKFNPTNNINPDDLEDRPLFTEPIANQMVVVDWAPLDDKLWFQGVYVPIFYPALLPPSAAEGLTDPQAPVPFARESDKNKISNLQNTLDINQGLVPTVNGNVIMPKYRFVDGQSAIKVGSSLGGVDMSVSYYNGRHDIPAPVRADSSTKEPPVGPSDTAECCFTTDVTLVYPRMQVIGADFTTAIPFLGNMGIWGEGALFFPTAKDLYLEFPIPIDVTPDDDETNPVSFVEGPSIRSRPFVKATAGLDYTFGKHVYVQGQYLRGFIDEFGADHIGNYVVGGTDLIFFGRHLIFRLFGVVDIPEARDDNGSYVIYPEVIVVPPWGSVTFELGSFFLLGKQDTKFGQRAAGTSIVFFKVTGTF